MRLLVDPNSSQDLEFTSSVLGCPPPEYPVQAFFSSSGCISCILAPPGRAYSSAIRMDFAFGQ